MTGILSNQLPGRANPPDADNPLGSFKDRTAPGANDGSYLTQTWSNDRDSILQALFIASGLIPNGIEDTGTASQLFDALVNNRWSSIGNYLPGTIVAASDGLQYYCKSPNGRDTTVVDPTTVLNRNTWVQYPFETVVNANGTAIIYYNDRVEISGRSSGADAGGFSVITLPITLSNTDYYVYPSPIITSPVSLDLVPKVAVVVSTKSTTGLSLLMSNGNNVSPVGFVCDYNIIGEL